MAYPKMKPCPNCGCEEHLAVYTYDNGARHVECSTTCGYLGPACTSVTAAIRHHNEEREARALSHAIHGILLDVAELPDRTSPEDAPDMMLVSSEELRSIIVHHMTKQTAA